MSSDTNSSKTPLLDQVSFPRDIRNFNIDQLKQLSNELRYETISAVSKTGGHLGAGLGVIELTVALHHVFNTPDDKIIWDVGHQTYPHKILTGRRDKIRTLRQPDGLSGFTKRSESEYDVFGAGHSSTSISAALGFAVARDLNNKKRNIIAVIGDGAMSAGMAYEAMNNGGAMNNRLIVILNDNDMSIAPPVGAMSNYLSRLAASKSYLRFRGYLKKFLISTPKSVANFPKKFEKAAKEWWMGGNIFEEMGFYYIGPIDGHNLDVLLPILQNIRDDNSNTPILIHCVTKKGHGYNDVMKSDDCLHAVSKFDPDTGIQQKSNSLNLTYSTIFGKSLVNEAKKDDKIVAITAAMPGGTGLDLFAKEFSEKGKNQRFFDVGIAEQHAVTFGAGLACDGVKPFVAIYSTFLQRAYDQVVHDVAVQKLPVRFMIDRAGFVGSDGPTHAGSFDIAYLANLPNFVLMAPADGIELARMVATAAHINDRPSAIRYPRGESKVKVDFNNITPLEIGKGRLINEGEKIAILSYGTILENALSAAEILKKNHNINITIADARFCKPLDHKLISNLAKNHQLLITIEEGTIGGFGSIVTEFLLENGFLDFGKLKLRCLFMKDIFVEQNSINIMQDQAGIGVNDIVNLVLNNNINKL